MKEINTDIAIIGAGPVGLFASFQAGMLGLKTCIFDALDFIGGQCAALYPEKPIYDIPAYHCITAQDLICNLEKQIAPFKPYMVLGQQVMNLEFTENKWKINSPDYMVRARCVIIAAGAGAFGPNKPPLTNLAEFENKSIFYMVRKKEYFRDRSIVIAGGGDSAVDWAIELSNIAKKVYLVHRRNNLRASPQSLKKLKELSKHVELVIPYQLHRITGDNGLLKEVHVIDLENNVKILRADILLPFFGLAMNLGPIAKWGLEFENKHIKVTQSSMATNLPGIFAIGDIATYESKLKLILTGFSEAASACNAAYKLIHPDKPLHFEYSTSKGTPK